MTKIDIHEYARRDEYIPLHAAIKRGADIDAQDVEGLTPLLSAIANQSENVINYLLKHNANVSLQDNDGSTALHYAAEFKLSDVVDELVKKDPKLVDVSDKHGNQPLWTAVFNANGDSSVVSSLLAVGADPNHRNNAGISPLAMAEDLEDDQLVKLLKGE